MQLENLNFLPLTAEQVASANFAVVRTDKNTIVVGHFQETDTKWLLHLELGFEIVKVGNHALVTPIQDCPIFPYGGYHGEEKPFQAYPIHESQFIGLTLHLGAIKHESSQMLNYARVGLN